MYLLYIHVCVYQSVSSHDRDRNFRPIYFKQFAQTFPSIILQIGSLAIKSGKPQLCCLGLLLEYQQFSRPIRVKKSIQVLQICIQVSRTLKYYNNFNTYHSQLCYSLHPDILHTQLISLFVHLSKFGNMLYFSRWPDLATEN